MTALRGPERRRLAAAVPHAAPRELAARPGAEALRVLQVELPPGTPVHEAVRVFKRRLIEVVLRETGGNRSAAARRLGIQRTYLHRLIRELAIDYPPAGPRLAHAASEVGACEHTDSRWAPRGPDG